MGKAPKSTKKFQKNHLKRTLDQRKVEQKYKQKVSQSKRKKGPRSASDDAEAAAPKANQNEVFEDMSVEDFLGGGFEVPAPLGGSTKPKNTKGAKGAKESKPADESEDESDNEAVDHKAQLDELAKKDPEFYKYLKENDQDLLDFNADSGSDSEDEGENDNDEDEDEDGEDVAESGAAALEEAQAGQIDITIKDVNAWKKSLAQERSLRALKKVLRAFSAVVHNTESDSITDSQYKYVVTNPEVFNRLLLLALSQVPQTVRHHIPLQKDKTVAGENKKLKTLSSSFKAYGDAICILLSGNYDSNTVSLILKSAREMMPYFLSHRRIVKDLIAAVVAVLCRASSDDAARLAAFSFLQEVASDYSKSLLEPILKASYSGFVKHSRRTNYHSMPAINMQKNLISSLYNLNPTVSYQLGFQFIRQLAIHLRSSIVNKTTESYKTIYNWQYAHSLDFWSRAISAQFDSRKDTPLKALILPLVQVTLGAMRLIPTPQYFPFRFYLVRSLIRLAQHSHVYIPLAPALMEILTSTTITKAPKHSTMKALDFDHTIRAAKSYLGTRVYQDGVGEQFVELLGEFFTLYCKSIAFPELCIPVIISLKRFTRKTKNAKLNRQIQKLVEKLEQNSKYIEAERSSVQFGPLNHNQVDAFLKNEPWEKTPLGAFTIVQREIKEEKVRILRESMEQENEEEEEKDELEELVNEIEDEDDEVDEDEEDEEDEE